MKFSIFMDEAGRGPLAADMYTGVSLVVNKLDLTDFKDSKKCTEKYREKLFEKILNYEKNKDIFYGIGTVSAKEIDTYGLTGALKLAYARGLYYMLRKFVTLYVFPKLSKSNKLEDIILNYDLIELFNIKKVDFAIIGTILNLLNKSSYIGTIFIDGNTDLGLGKALKYNVKNIIDGDDLVPGISMASIAAKVSRDAYMKSLPKKYDKYEFAAHKGYGTAKHIQAIQKYGICDLHRRLFLKKMAGKIGILISELPPFKTTSQVLINKQKIVYSRKKLLLHVCCAPDMSVPYETLDKYFDLYILWYNPNINNEKEHTKRYLEFKKLCKIYNVQTEVETQYDSEMFNDNLFKYKNEIGFSHMDKKQFINQIAQMPEGGERCLLCFTFRLQKALEIAKNIKADYLATTLSISPKKDYSKILKAWSIVAKSLKTPIFLDYDFKKNEGYKKACELTKQYGIWRQDYCGCNYGLNKNIKTK